LKYRNSPAKALSIATPTSSRINSPSFASRASRSAAVNGRSGRRPLGFPDCPGRKRLPILFPRPNVPSDRLQTVCSCPVIWRPLWREFQSSPLCPSAPPGATSAKRRSPSADRRPAYRRTGRYRPKRHFLHRKMHRLCWAYSVNLCHYYSLRR